jgi:hypothetical protein
LLTATWRGGGVSRRRRRKVSGEWILVWLLLVGCVRLRRVFLCLRLWIQSVVILRLEREVPSAVGHFDHGGLSLAWVNWQELSLQYKERRRTMCNGIGCAESAKLASPTQWQRPPSVLYRMLTTGAVDSAGVLCGMGEGAEPNGKRAAETVVSRTSRTTQRSQPRE